MSVCNEDGEKVDLPRDPGGVEQAVMEWAGTDNVRHRSVAMVMLHEICGYTQTRIAQAFNLDQGTVSRAIEATKRSLSLLPGLQEFAPGT